MVRLKPGSLRYGPLGTHYSPVRSLCQLVKDGFILPSPKFCNIKIIFLILQMRNAKVRVVK